MTAKSRIGRWLTMILIQSRDIHCLVLRAINGGYKLDHILKLIEALYPISQLTLDDNCFSPKLRSWRFYPSIIVSIYGKNSVSFSCTAIHSTTIYCLCFSIAEWWNRISYVVLIFSGSSIYAVVFQKDCAPVQRYCTEGWCDCLPAFLWIWYHRRMNNDSRWWFKWDGNNRTVKKNGGCIVLVGRSIQKHDGRRFFPLLPATLPACLPAYFDSPFGLMLDGEDRSKAPMIFRFALRAIR